MSFETLEESLFTENSQWVSITVGSVKHKVPMDIILNFSRSTNLAEMILLYVVIKDDNPDQASEIFSQRNGQLFSHILHNVDTNHFVYPSDQKLTKTLLEDLHHYGFIRINDGYCDQCVLAYIQTRGLMDFRRNKLGDDFNFVPETVIIQAKNAKSEIFAIRAWGPQKALADLFPKQRIENDDTYFQLSRCVTVIHTDPCELMKQMANTLGGVKRLGFRATSTSTWSEDLRFVRYNQWFLYRALPAMTSIPAARSFLAISPVASIQNTWKAKKKRIRLSLRAKEETSDIPTEYPEIPSSTSAAPD